MSQANDMTVYDFLKPGNLFFHKKIIKYRGKLFILNWMFGQKWKRKSTI